MRYYLKRSDDYLVTSLEPPDDVERRFPRYFVEVPDELVARFEAARAEWEAVQDEFDEIERKEGVGR